MKELLNETLGYFEVKKRGEDDIVVLKPEAPQALKDSIRAAHGDRLPDDWIYNKYQSIVSNLSGYTISNTDDLEENRPEIVDGLVDVYNNDRTAWLASHLGNAALVDEARAEYGGDCSDVFDMIGKGQYYAIDQIYSEVVSYLTAEAEVNAEAGE